MGSYMIGQLQRSHLRVVGLFFFVGMLTTACHSQLIIPSKISSLSSDYKLLQQQASAHIREQIDQHNLHAISISLIHDQEVIWAEGFGLADKTTNRVASGDTIYQVGSISKPLTALAIMQLAERHEIDIDQSLQTYIPGFTIRNRFRPGNAFYSPLEDSNGKPIISMGDGNSITLRSMLSHHSGLPTDLNKGMYSKTSLSEFSNALTDEYVAYPPNLVYSYSNVAYSLLGHALEKISKQSYDQYMQQALLQPLNMQHSTFTAEEILKSNLATGYSSEKIITPLPIRDLPAQGLYSSAQDLAQIVKMVFAGGVYRDKRLIMHGTLENMFELQNAATSLDFNIHNALGWFLEDSGIEGEHVIVRHGGTTMLHNSEMALFPEYKLGVIVLSNDATSRRIIKRIAQNILKISLDALRPEHSHEGILVDTIPSAVNHSGPNDMNGNYCTQFGMVKLSGNNSRILIEGVNRFFKLIRHPDHWFSLHPDAVNNLPDTLKPLCQVQLSTKTINRRHVMLAKKGEKKLLLGELAPSGPIPKKWLDRMGKYSVINPDDNFPLSDLELREYNKHLWLSYRLPRLSKTKVNVPLVILNDTEAVIQGLGRTRGETVRIQTIDGKEHLRHSGFIGKRVD